MILITSSIFATKNRKGMALIKKVRGFTPKTGLNCYMAETATIIGDVTIGDNCSIWFNTVLRGDVNSIRIGNQSLYLDQVPIESAAVWNLTGAV